MEKSPQNIIHEYDRLPYMVFRGHNFAVDTAL